MVLENSHYPLDARVRMEAETLIESGLSVEVLAPREADRPAREIIRGVRVTRFPLPDGNGKLLGTAIEYLLACIVIAPLVLLRLARGRGGTLHVHNPPDLFFPLLWIARLRGWSTVFDHHDDAAGILHAKLGRATPAGSLLAWMRGRSARVADLTVTTNDTQRKLVQADARHVVIVRNSPPIWFAEHRPSPPPAGRSRLVFLGEIGVQDRVRWTVDILAALVSDRNVDAELLIVGDGPERQAIEEHAQELGVAERVTITGWVPFEEVPRLLASAHVGLDTAAATDVNDGSTMVKIMEYLVVGLPVVATALRETRVTGADAVVTVVEDSVEAYVTPIADLLSSPENWQAQADRARARGGELLWPAQGKKLVTAYRELGAR
jgi:glycosyltransferase involved in cell wall biosynthesis